MTDSSKDTLSHRLAENAALSRHHEVHEDARCLTDLGWNQDGSRDQREWIPGLHNEDVWLLQRRMNKVCSPFSVDPEKLDHLCQVGC